jgi:cytoskeletal protein RodZ
MKRDRRVGSTALVAVAILASSIALTTALTACGADDSAPPPSSPATSSSSSQVDAAHDAVQQSAPDSRAAFLPDASAAYAPSASFAADVAAASDPIAQTMQANLAADSQQIAPVMHYAPGDGARSN